MFKSISTAVYRSEVFVFLISDQWLLTVDSSVVIRNLVRAIRGVMKRIDTGLKPTRSHSRSPNIDGSQTEARGTLLVSL